MHRRRVPRAGFLVAAALVLVTAPHGMAQVDCNDVDVRGVRPGMSVREVRSAMGGRADRIDHLTVDGTARSTAVYSRTPYTVLVHYDSEVSRRASSARVLAVEETAGSGRVDAGAVAAALSARLGGAPHAGGAPFGADGPSRWTFGTCGLAVEARMEPGSWWDPSGRGSLVVRLERVPVESPPVAAVVVSTSDATEAPAIVRPEPRVARDDEPAVARSNDPETPPEQDLIAQAPAAQTEPPRASADPLAAIRTSERPPVRIGTRSAPPVFPALARRLRLQADVTLDIVVRQDGSVGDVVVARSTLPGYGFEDAAVQAVRGWRYEPALRDGRPIDAPLSVIVTFR